MASSTQNARCVESRTGALTRVQDQGAERGAVARSGEAPAGRGHLNRAATRRQAPACAFSVSSTPPPLAPHWKQTQCRASVAPPGPWTTAGGFGRGRKVRAPTGKVVGNAHRPRGQGKCHREQTAGRSASPTTARVKRRGKSSPRIGQPIRHGKPHLEEDRIGGSRCPRPDPRVGRSRPSARTVLEKWSSLPAASLPAGRSRTRLTGTRHLFAAAVAISRSVAGARGSCAPWRRRAAPAPPSPAAARPGRRARGAAGRPRAASPAATTAGRRGP